MADIFDSYTPADAWDEMFESPGAVRPAYAAVFAALQPLDAGDLRFRTDQMARAFTDRGVTYSYGGEERPFPLDLVPRVLEAVEWDGLVRGVRQRVLALEAFLADAYGRQRVLADGVVPYRLLYSSPHFHRAAHGIEPPGGVRIHVAGIDLVRDEAGRFRVLEDNVRVPSGVSYVIENRRVMTRTFPSLFADQPVRPVDEYPQRLLAALRACAPDGVDEPVVVVLTPGVHNAAYFEHALLARLMGVQLVEGRDLVCVNNRVRMRTTRGEQPVHVVYRRLDDDFLDPLHFRPDSVIGVPGILGAAHAGNVTLANAVGNGIADDKLLYTYVPDLIRYYLAEEPLLPNVETIRPEEPGRLEEVLDQLDRLVLKPVDGAGGKGIVIGPKAERPRLAALAKEVAADPRGWIAQRPVALSTSPTLSRSSDGRDVLAPRHIDLRPFAVHDGRDVWLLPGGLTRVALGEGNLIVNSSQGGGSKDTWVLPGPRVPTLEETIQQAAPQPDVPVAVQDVSPRQLGPGSQAVRTQEEAQQQ
ncbi:circularly permuted type 2 ATP-grasp protein [Streptacidiphilus monticola]|uniref:Circularly permuted type 2 ATP-grasp protein n=1 Tax=Streptacidiphilus monticola TaxID=2161674 RepID=A0ABW1G2D5_9ACTN